MIRTDVVGGVQAIADEWVSVADELRRLDAQLTELQNKRNNLLSQQMSLSQRLTERVGGNVQTRAYVVGPQVLIVDHERGIRLVPMEP